MLDRYVQSYFEIAFQLEREFQTVNILPSNRKKENYHGSIRLTNESKRF